MEDFATYILNERNHIQKMIIAYYMSQKTRSFFDKSIVLRAEIAYIFLHKAFVLSGSCRRIFETPFNLFS